MKHKGFTVVELIIVIVVIAILASITIVSYTFIQEDAADTKIRSAMRSAGDAIVLYESRTGSTVPGIGMDDMDSTLVPNYLKPGYRDGLTSKNTTLSSYNGGQVISFYRCNATGSVQGSFVIFGSLNNPTTEDIGMYTKAVETCMPWAPPYTHPIQYNYALFF